MHHITKQRQYTLRVDLHDWDDATRYAEYSLFNIGDEESKYKLTYFGYTGDASDSLGNNHRGRPFSTMDHDNDVWSENCALRWQSGWWYHYCYDANLNGPYGNVIGVRWHLWKNGEALKSSVMRIRPTFSDDVLSP